MRKNEFLPESKGTVRRYVVLDIPTHIFQNKVYNPLLKEEGGKRVKVGVLISLSYKYTYDDEGFNIDVPLLSHLETFFEIIGLSIFEKDNQPIRPIMAGYASIHASGAYDYIKEKIEPKIGDLVPSNPYKQYRTIGDFWKAKDIFYSTGR